LFVLGRVKVDLSSQIILTRTGSLSPIFLSAVYPYTTIVSLNPIFTYIDPPGKEITPMVKRKSAVSRRNTLFLLLGLACLLLAGCGVKTKAHVVDPVPEPEKIAAENTIEIRELHFSGALRGRHRDLITPFSSGFTATGSQLVCLPEAEYPDALLDVAIDTRYSPTGATKAKHVPIVGGMMYAYSGGALNFDWEGTVRFTLFDDEGNTLAEDSFQLSGVDCMENTDGVVGLGTSYFTGAGTSSVFYPDEQALHQLGNAFLRATGFEIAKRLRTGPARTYFEARTREREGMDAKAYAEFTARKKNLIRERESMENRRQQELQAAVADPVSAESLENGSVMVFSVGVDRYDHYPDLSYAASDSRRIVEYFRNRYSLSDSWAISLTDREATAARVNRFINRNAARLLAENDTFIFYFSGHGTPDVDSSATDPDGLEKYLLLADSEPGTLPLTAISLTELAGLLSDLPCRKVVIFIDSCFAGEAGREVLSTLKSVRISDYTYKNTADNSGRGRVILAASSENQVSQEREEIGAGVFTHYLIEGLDRKADADGNDRVDILELYNYVSDKVEHYTGGAQTPVFRGTIDRNFEF
jgi:hypothetical protein